MLRILGALSAVVGAGGFGYLIAAGLDDRAANLRSLVNGLQHLESDITYAALPLNTALRRSAEVVGGRTAVFLREAAEGMERADGRSAVKVWSEALTRQAGELLLSPAELEVLQQLGTVLGGSDREDQQKHINLARATLAQFQIAAEAAAGKTKRVWQYLGFTVGGLMVILLY